MTPATTPLQADARRLLSGIRARDLRRVLSPRDPTEAQAQRSRLTRTGHEVTTAALACRRASLEQLAAYNVCRKTHFVRLVSQRTAGWAML